MAPTPPTAKAPSARTLRLQRISGQIHPLLPAKTFRSGASVSDDFLSTKRDKRLMKHSSFVSRITSSKVSKIKRRRPQNKLKTSLDSLADALPELKAGEGNEEVLAGKIKHKSLRSKKGALKRKERIVKGEMERFGASMANLAESQGTVAKTTSGHRRINKAEDSNEEEDDEMTQCSAPLQITSQPTPALEPNATSNRWAALRGYISATMEQNPAFVDK